MIITCEQCQTRFKVGDDKLAQGPIRVRCSKCNHVFTASIAGSLVSTPPPLAVSFPTTPGMSSTGHTATMVHEPFQPPGASGSPASGVPRAGIFRPPSGSGPLPAMGGVDPFAPRPIGGAVPRGIDPFGLGSPPFPPNPRPPSNPFASLAPASAPQGETGDPFAGLGASSVGAAWDRDAVATVALPRASSRPVAFPPPSAPSPSGPDPFGATPRSPGIPAPATPGRLSGGIPFSEPTASHPGLPRPPSMDPFAGIGAAPPSAAIDTARGSLGPSSQEISDPFASARFVLPPATVADPFGGSAAPSATMSADALFGLAVPTDPFAHLAHAPDQVEDSFSLKDPENFDLEIDDVDVQETQPQAAAPFESGDPFASLDADDAPIDAVGLTPPPPPSGASGSHPSSPSMAPQAAPQVDPPGSPTEPTPARRVAKLRRFRTGQGAKELAWAAAQGVLFASFLVVAVVLARGGALAELGRGEVRAALRGGRSSDQLVVDEVRIDKRELPSGLGFVVVTGVVHNRGSAAVPFARVELRFNDDPSPAAFGWAPSSIDGIDVEALATAAEGHTLSQRSPTAARLAPGARAPFVIIAPAPAQGTRARVLVQPGMDP